VQKKKRIYNRFETTTTTTEFPWMDLDRRRPYKRLERIEHPVQRKMELEPKLREIYRAFKREKQGKQEKGTALPPFSCFWFQLRSGYYLDGEDLYREIRPS
jgi:hypothetical protein